MSGPDDDEKLDWTERALQGTKNCVEFVKEHGTELFAKVAVVTGIAAAASYAAGKFGIEVANDDVVKAAVAFVVVAYKITKAIRNEIMKKKEDNPQEAPLSADSISIEDFRSMQENMDHLLQSHQAVVHALTQSQAANGTLAEANQDLQKANQVLKSAMSSKYNTELNNAEDHGLIDRSKFGYKEDEPVVVISHDQENDTQEDDELAESHTLR